MREAGGGVPSGHGNCVASYRFGATTILRLDSSTCVASPLDMPQWIDSELDLLQQWITERERVRAAKESGLPKPWTSDPLLRDFRWCNVRRMDDRVSRELLSGWYREVVGSSVLPAAALARLVNWPEALFEVSGGRPFSAGCLARSRQSLRERSARGEKVFTGAYVVPGVPGREKVDSVMDVVERLHEHSAEVLLGSMRETWAALIKFDGLGSFLAGQIVADIAQLRTGEGWSDLSTWAPLGPGSARGINRLRGIPKDKAVSQEDFETLLPALIVTLRPRIEAIWLDRNLHAMDIQNCLCEFDKYRRLQLQEGKVRARYNGTADAQGPGAHQQTLFA